MAQDTGDISFLLNLNTNTWILPCVLHVCSWGNSSTCDNGTNCDLLTPLSLPPFPSPCSFFCSPDPRRLPTPLATDFLLRSHEGEEFLYAHGPGDLRLFLVESGLGPGSPFCQQNPGKGGPRKPGPPQEPPEPAFFSNHASFQGLSGIWRQELFSHTLFQAQGGLHRGERGTKTSWGSGIRALLWSRQGTGSIGFTWLLGQGGVLRSFSPEQAARDSSGAESLLPQGRRLDWDRVGRKGFSMDAESSMLAALC